MAKKQTKRAGNKSKGRRKSAAKRRRPASGLLEMEDVLRKVNFVQVERKTATFAVSASEAPVIRNVLRDAGVEVKETVTETSVTFEVAPGPEPEVDQGELDGLDEMSDEIIEDGQVFD